MYVPLRTTREVLRGLGATAAQAKAMMQRAELQPIIDGFSGATLTEKLGSGFEAARGALLRYTSTLSFSSDEADAVIHEIESWHALHQQDIDASINDPARDTLPEQIALSFGPEKARQMIVAAFSEAARGLGPWLSGDIAANYKTDPTIPESFVVADANDRLVVFASIVKMDTDGDLEKIFLPEQWAAGHPQAQDGLGVFQAVVAAVGAKLLVTAVVLIFLGTVAMVLMFIHSMRRTSLNNAIMAERCKAAEARGDTETVRLCIKLASAAGADDSIMKTIKTIATVALVGGALWLGATLVLPRLMAPRRARA